MNKERRAFERGAMAAFTEVLNMLNTLDEVTVDKKELYRKVSDLRPGVVDWAFTVPRKISKKQRRPRR